MKEILFTCDVCGDRTPATHVGLEVKIGTTKPKLLDLCDHDYQTKVGPMIELLDQYGYTDTPTKTRAKKVAPAAAPVPAPTPVEAPVSTTYDQEGPFQCGLCTTQPKHIKSFSNHARSVHGMTLVEYREKHGDPIPVGS